MLKKRDKREMIASFTHPQTPLILNAYKKYNNLDDCPVTPFDERIDNERNPITTIEVRKAIQNLAKCESGELVS